MSTDFCVATEEPLRRCSPNILLVAQIHVIGQCAVCEFIVSGRYFDIVAALFTSEEHDIIRFGWSARSIEAATIDDLEVASVGFRDYIMEGFVEYGLHLRQHCAGLILEIKKQGTNRDEYIAPQIKFYVTDAGLTFEDEDTT